MNLKNSLLFTSFFIVSVTISTINASQAESKTPAAVAALPKCSTILLPSAKQLQERLNEICLSHFVQKTSIHTTLGGKEMTALGAAMEIDLALMDYEESLKLSKMALLLRINRTHLIKAVLQDSPDAIQELIDKGALEA